MRAFFKKSRRKTGQPTAKNAIRIQKNRSTRQAIHCIRRAAEYGEGTGKQMIMVLLDWEKAFDKVDRQGLFRAIERMNIHEDPIQAVTSLYHNTQFTVESDGNTSEKLTQTTGIRQGCPLSPYLFLIMMTTMFEDIHKEDTHNLIQHRIKGANFDEVVYADDTICVSTDSRAMNKFLAHIETQGKQYNMKLNYSKCEVFTTGNTTPSIHFADGTKKTHKPEVKYLGCMLNRKCDPSKKIKLRKAECQLTLKKLDRFWCHSACTKTFKVRVLNAVIRSKLLYGFESAQLNQTDLTSLDAFHKKGLRKIMHWKTTYQGSDNPILRENKDENLWDTINKMLQHEWQQSENTKKEKATAEGRMHRPSPQPKPLASFSDYYKQERRKMLADLLTRPLTDPQRAVTFEPHFVKQVDHGVKRRGGQRLKWVREAATDYWSTYKNELTGFSTQDFDENNAEHATALEKHAVAQQQKATRTHSARTRTHGPIRTYRLSERHYPSRPSTPLCKICRKLKTFGMEGHIEFGEWYCSIECLWR